MPPQSIPQPISLDTTVATQGNSQNVGLQVGWTVVYRDAKDRLQDGRIIEILDPSASGRVNLDSGVTLPIAKITAVKAVDQAGHCIAAWTVNPHSYDGSASANLPMLTGPDGAPRSRRQAVIVGIVVILLVLVGAFWAFGRKSGDATAAKGPAAAAPASALPKVTVVTPGRDTVMRTVTGT